MTLQLGRRGAFLVLFAVVYALIGYSYLTLSPASVKAVRMSLHWALNVAPLPVWGWVWIATAVIAAASGLFAPGRKAAGFVAGVVMPVLWGLANLAAWISRDVPRGWVSAAIYAALAAAVGVVAGMPEPAALKVPR